MALITIVFGLIIGSFLTVCIHRIPYGREMGPPNWDEEEDASGEADTVVNADEVSHGDGTETQETMSLCSPARSICPNCKRQLLWWHNIPLFSWILLGGKCGFCKEKIPFRYPLVEFLSALFCYLSFSIYDFTSTGILIYLFSAMLIVISFIDIDYYIIPDVISLPGIVIGLCVGVFNHIYPNTFVWPVVPDLWWSLGGVLAGGGTLFVISEVYFRVRKRIGLGMGDVKLLALTGAFLGPEGAFYTMFVGSLAGSVIGVILILLSGKRMNYQLPFGPYLALGTLLYFFTSKVLGNWYL